MDLRASAFARDYAMIFFISSAFMAERYCISSLSLSLDSSNCLLFFSTRDSLFSNSYLCWDNACSAADFACSIFISALILFWVAASISRPAPSPGTPSFPSPFSPSLSSSSRPLVPAIVVYIPSTFRTPPAASSSSHPSPLLPSSSVPPSPST
jgi:hypothetical protein